MNKSEIKKILIIRYRFVGDTVLSTPFIKNVKEIFPNAEVDILVSPNSGELIEGNPNIRNVYYLDNSNFHKYEQRTAETGQQRRFHSLIGCALGLRKNNYDLIFVLKRSFSSALLASVIGAKYRVGFDTELRSLFLTHKIQYNKNAHEADNFLENLKPFEENPKKYNTEIFPTEREKEKALNLLTGLDRYKLKVGFHMTSAHPYKQWRKKHIGRLIDFLFEEHGAQFIFTGANIDKKFYEKSLFFAVNGGKVKYLNLCGLTSLRECYAIYENLDLIICVDSGNAHLAAATGKPTYVLYGPTKPDKWLPIGQKVKNISLKQPLECQPCNVKVRCGHINCMRLLLPTYVFNSIEKEQLKL